MHLVRLILPLLFAFGLSCAGSTSVGTVDSGPVDADTDTDTDADSDSDADTDADTDADADADADADTDTDTTPDDVDPIILEFSVNPSTVNPDEAGTFYALVTDPQGIADLIGGSLKSDDGTTIAAFSSSADEGSYSTSVEFDTLAEAFAEDTTGNSGTMTVTASFYDQAGHITTDSLDVVLECDGSNDDLCSEGCVDVSRDEQNCGGCDSVCATKLTASGLTAVPSEMDDCTSGTCLAVTACVKELEATSDTCNKVCGAAGTTCAGVVFHWNPTCSDFKEYVAKTSTDFCGQPMNLLIQDSGNCVCEL
jgi:hypothetical protein